jgi:hypothetical protein
MVPNNLAFYYSSGSGHCHSEYPFIKRTTKSYQIIWHFIIAVSLANVCIAYELKMLEKTHLYLSSLDFLQVLRGKY